MDLDIRKVTAPGRTDRIIDIDTFIDQFDLWQTFFNKLIEEKGKLSEELKTSQTENRRLVEKIDSFTKSTNDMQSTIDMLHRQLHSMCDLDEETKTLKAEILMKEKEIIRMKNTIVANEAKNASDLRRNQEAHRAEVEQAVLIVKRQAASDIAAIQALVEERDAEITKYAEKCSKLTKEKETSITRITLDYENKIAKLQRQKAQSIQNAPGASGQEIFRRKLQHMKLEYEREVAQLKQSVKDLQDKITTQSFGQRDRLSLSVAKKRR